VLIFKYLRAEAVCKFFEIDCSVVVLVELDEQVDAVVLQRGVGISTLFDLVKDVLEVLLRENVRVVFHVFLRVLIGRH
jgi:uncharacterized radical SAM superfamily protein